MRTRIVSTSVVVGMMGLLLALGVYAGPTGNLEPLAPPDSTLSYTLQDIYNRLDAGVAGAQSTFTEPSSGPGSGSGHTLNEVMAKAPAADNANGAMPADVRAGKSYWGLRTDGTWGMQTGTADPAPVPQTGQAGCWDGNGNPRGCAGTGQDGEYQKGVEWPDPRFTANGNGTVTDNLTGLMWLQNANCLGKRTWTTALALAKGGNPWVCTSAGGILPNDWRLPSIRELHSLIDYSQHDWALPSGNPFAGVQPGGYWSSTTDIELRNRAWSVDITDGSVSSSSKGGANYVWPVRGGQ